MRAAVRLSRMLRIGRASTRFGGHLGVHIGRWLPLLWPLVLRPHRGSETQIVCRWRLTPRCIRVGCNREPRMPATDRYDKTDMLDKATSPPGQLDAEASDTQLGRLRVPADIEPARVVPNFQIGRHD